MVQKTDASLSPVSTSSSLFQAFIPPVPPLPTDTERVASPIADVFTAQHSHNALPSIFKDLDNQSVLKIESTLTTPSPEISANSKQSVARKKAASHGKRRSMSVGEFELKMAMEESSSATPLLPDPQEEGPAWGNLHGIITDFKGELCQLDPVLRPSLDLRVRDPSTPSRQAALARVKSDGHKSFTVQDERSGPKTLDDQSVPPTLTLQLASHSDDLEVTQFSDMDASSVAPAIVPPRISSLQTPTRSTFGNTPSPRVQSASRQASTPIRTWNGKSFGSPTSPPTHGHSSSRDSYRSRIHHRTASSSEPSLISAGDEARVRERSNSIRLVSHSNAMSPTLAVSSHQDLITNDLRHPSNPSLSPATGDENSDIEIRGKELASRCWAQDEEFLAKEKIAEWLGGLSVGAFGERIGF